MEDQELEGYVSIGRAASLIGVSIATLRRWCKNELFKIEWIRTLGNHRRFSIKGIKEFLGIEKPLEDSRLHIGYARVSSHDQKKDLETQIQTIKGSLPENHQIISDIGSGLNYNKSGFKKLEKLILSNKVASLTITYKDRLLRFGSDIIFDICKKLNVKVNVLFAPRDVPFEQELAMDMITLATVFAARLYGKRSHQNKKKKAESQLA